MTRYAWVMDLTDPDAVPEVGEAHGRCWCLMGDRSLGPAEVLVIAEIEGPPPHDDQAFVAARSKMMSDREAARLEEQRASVLSLLNRAANYGRLQAQEIPGTSFESNPGFWTAVGIAHMVAAREASPYLAAQAWAEMQAPVAETADG